MEYTKQIEKQVRKFYLIQAICTRFKLTQTHINTHWKFIVKKPRSTFKTQNVSNKLTHTHKHTNALLTLTDQVRVQQPKTYLCISEANQLRTSTDSRS